MKKTSPPPRTNCRAINLLTAIESAFKLFSIKAVSAGRVLLIVYTIIIIAGCSKQKDSLLSESRRPETVGYDFSIDATLKAIAFTTFSDYRLYLSTDNRTAIFNKLKDMGHASLYEAVKNGKKTRVTGIVSAGASDESAWFEDEDASNLTKILNPDGILVIDQFAIKIGDNGEWVYIARKSDAQSQKVYNILKDEEEQSGVIFKYPTDYDIVDMLEEVGLPTGNVQQQSLFCWGRSGAKMDNYQPAIYFLDETWPASTISLTANDQYALTSNSRVSIKLEYLKLGVFFQLVLKGKYDREDGSLGVNADNIFSGSAPWGTGEGNWNIVYTEKHQGKCKKDNEVLNSGTLVPPMNNENKTRRVFWESDNGLHKYSIVASLNLRLRAAWIGVESEAYHGVATNQFFSIPAPRIVSSNEIYPFTQFNFADGY